MNPFAGLAQSRKFWLLVLDVAIALITYFVTKYATPSYAEDVLFFIGAMQPIFIALIAGIAWEDASEKRAGTFRRQ